MTTTVNTDITNTFVQSYRTAVELLAQQKGAKLSGCTDEEGVQGEAVFYDQFGNVHAEEIANRYGDTPRMDPENDRRRLTTVGWDVATLVTKQDLIRTLDDPTNKIVIAQGYSLGRIQDQVKIDAMRGNAYTGKTGSNALALPSAQKIVHASAGLTLAKLLNVKEIMDGNDVPDEDRYIAVTAKQMTNLLNTTEIKSADYNTIKALAQGQVDTFLNFTFKNINGTRKDGTKIIPLDANSNRACVAWQKMGVLFGTGMNPNFRISVRDDKRYATQAYGAMDVGAVRMQEKYVVEIACVES
jgi:hypothetical protein